MCFTVDKDHAEPKAAGRSIRVWKRFQVPKNSLTLTSPYRSHDYRVGELSTLNEPLLVETDFRPRINRGFHSYSSLKTANARAWTDEIIVECTVPKGSTYYWNPRANEIVSDRLLLKAIKPTRPVKTSLSFPARAKKAQPVWWAQLVA